MWVWRIFECSIALLLLAFFHFLVLVLMFFFTTSFTYGLNAKPFSCSSNSKIPKFSYVFFPYIHICVRYTVVHLIQISFGGIFMSFVQMFILPTQKPNGRYIYYDMLAHYLMPDCNDGDLAHAHSHTTIDTAVKWKIVYVDFNWFLSFDSFSLSLRQDNMHIWAFRIDVPCMWHLLSFFYSDLLRTLNKMDEIWKLWTIFRISFPCYQTTVIYIYVCVYIIVQWKMKWQSN